MREDRREEPSLDIDVALCIGAALIGLGALCLLYIVVLVTQILKSPEESDLVQWVMEAAQRNEMILSGHSGEKNFSIEASEAFQYIIMAILGLIVVRLITSIFMAFINQGIKLVLSNKTKSSDLKNQSEPTYRSKSKYL